MLRNSPRRVRPRLEWLEDRLALAGDFSVMLVGGTLRIEGSDNADDIRVYDNPDDGMLWVEIREVPGGTLRVSARFDPSEVEGVAVLAKGGNDLVHCRLNSHRVVISGGDGNDEIHALAQALVFGGNGNDTIGLFVGAAYGEDGNDALRGGLGNVTLSGGNGDDQLVGGWGDDRLYGDAGNDILIGDGLDLPTEDHSMDRAGNDFLDGGAGNDHLYGDNGDPHVSPYDRPGGNDVLYGRAGADFLAGEGGNDYLHPGCDNDRDAMYGNAGADAFGEHYAPGSLLAGSEMMDFNRLEGDTAFQACRPQTTMLASPVLFPSDKGSSSGKPADRFAGPPLEALNPRAAMPTLLIQKTAAPGLVLNTPSTSLMSFFGDPLGKSVFPA